MTQRLNFKLDEFVRISWVSRAAQDKWAPIFSDISAKFVNWERAVVEAGFRRVALQQTDDLIALMNDTMQRGLSVIPLEKVNWSSHYQSQSTAFNPNLPHGYKVAIGKQVDVRKFTAAYHLGDNEKMGGLLGYPECCREFFLKYWVREGWFDTTWPMVDGYDKQTIHFKQLDPRNNILLRWLGLRPVSHLPCSFACQDTRGAAESYKRVAGVEDWNQLMDILSWPVEWNSLHGIAQIITPVCKITTATDALAQKRTVRLVNNKIPDEAGSGIEFPFIVDIWTDNGFPSLTYMRKAHDQVLTAIRSYSPRSVLDLGSGNGELLRRIRVEFGADTWGVDKDFDKRPDLTSDIWNFDFDQTGGRTFDMVLIAAQRLIENPDGWEKLERKIAQNVKNLVIYNYLTNAVEIKTYDKATVAG
jgi:hypothetical protein